MGILNNVKLNVKNDTPLLISEWGNSVACAPLFFQLMRMFETTKNPLLPIAAVPAYILFNAAVYDTVRQPGYPTYFAPVINLLTPYFTSVGNSLTHTLNRAHRVFNGN